MPRPRIPDHELVRRIGSGSYGEVWLVRSVLGTSRAAKVVWKTSFCHQQPYDREFRGIQKFEPLSRLHPAFLQVLHVGRNDEEGYFYYIMELADDARTGGGVYVPRTLAGDLGRSGRLAVSECVRIGLSLASALELLHANKLVHRDIKPANVIFVGGVPKLADIGLVAEVSEARTYVGTEGYIPPEGPGTAQADLYSFGKMLYELSTGKDRHAFPELPADLAERSEVEELVELNAILLKACQPEPRNRYASAEAMHADLLLLQTGRSVRRTHVLERRLKRMTRLGASLAAILILGAVPYFLAVREARLSSRMAAREAELRNRADLEAQHARNAEAAMREKLVSAYVAQARAERLGHAAGRRGRALQLLNDAAAIRPSAEQRTDAIACLALPDLQLQREWELGTGEEIYCFDPLFDRYAIGNQEGDIQLRSLRDDHQLALLPGFGPGSLGLQFSADGHWLGASYSGPSAPLQFWDLDRKAVVFQAPVKTCRIFALSPDGKLVAVNEFRGPIHILDLRSQQILHSFPETHLLWDLAFSPDNRQLAVSSAEEKAVQILDVAAGSTNRVLSLSAPAFGISWSADGSLLACGLGDGKIALWDTLSGTQHSVLSGHQAPVMSVNFVPQGDFLLSLAWDQQMKLWNLATTAEICERQISAYHARFDPRDSRLYCRTGQTKLGVLLFEAAQESRLLRPIEKSAKSAQLLAFSPDGRFLISSGAEGLRSWDVSTARQRLLQPCGPVTWLGFDPQGRFITLEPGKVSRWRPGWWQQRASTTPSDMSLFSGSPHDATLRAGTAPLALVSARGLEITDLQTGKTRATLTPETSWGFGALSHDGRLAAAGWHEAKSVAIFDVSNSCALTNVASELLTRIEFSPDDQLLLCGGVRSYSMYSTASWQKLWEAKCDGSGWFGAKFAFAPDGLSVAVVLNGQGATLLNSVTGHELARLQSPEPSNIQVLRFSPDGSLLAGTRADSLIELWDLKLIRRQLARMHLDWDAPPFAEPSANAAN